VTAKDLATGHLPPTRGSNRLWVGGGWAVVLIAVVALTGAAFSQSPDPALIAEGVELDGIPLGGKTAAEAEPLIAALAERKLRRPLLLRAPGRSARRTAGELGATCDVPSALEASLAAGTEGSALERLQARLPLLGGRKMTLPLQLDAATSRERLARVTRTWGAAPVEPRFRWKAGRATLVPGRAGRRLDAKASQARLEAALASIDWQAAAARSVADGETTETWLAGQAPLPVDLVMAVAPPRVTHAHFAAITTPLARFSTRFRTGERNRAHNIRIAAQAIDGVILLPGDVFSYNTVVGRRTRKRGYRMAPQIVDGELVPGIGGGVCQVSSTLYNAVLLADLEIVERRHHQIPVRYLPSGRDATVADGYLDLRFRNRLGRPVAIGMATEGSRLIAHVFGAPEYRRQVRLLRQGIRTVRPPARRRDEGKPPRNGVRVTVVRVVKEPSGTQRREIVSRDYYRPR
jgi:vancomycin resistance protein YoaR